MKIKAPDTFQNSVVSRNSYYFIFQLVTLFTCSQYVSYVSNNILTICFTLSFTLSSISYFIFSRHFYNIVHSIVHSIVHISFHTLFIAGGPWWSCWPLVATCSSWRSLAAPGCSWLPRAAPGGPLLLLAVTGGS